MQLRSQAGIEPAALAGCNLCLWIICKLTKATLNKRNELVSSCRPNKKIF
jgi:hypothetical protein